MARKTIASRKGAASRKVGPAGEPIATGVSAAQDRIAARAYEIYRQRCQAGQPGDALCDWLTAESELLGRSTQA